MLTFSEKIILCACIFCTFLKFYMTAGQDGRDRSHLWKCQIAKLINTECNTCMVEANRFLCCVLLVLSRDISNENPNTEVGLRHNRLVTTKTSTTSTVGGNRGFLE